MQNQQNCYENVWILSGTSDGPILADKLLKLNYVVFVSVVTKRACKSYLKNPKLHIITGKMKDKDEIVNFIKINKINIVIDATHSFALIISKNINEACNEVDLPLLAFQRESFIKKSRNLNYISGLKCIKNNDLKNKNILLAIGSRFLNDTAEYYMNGGANVFARVLPISESVSKALGSCIKNSNIAIINPSQTKGLSLEKKLCEFWKIDYILCRESGSYAQKNWENITCKSSMKLFVVKRPKFNYDNACIFYKHDGLIDYITKRL